MSCNIADSKSKLDVVSLEILKDGQSKDIKKNMGRKIYLKN